MVVLVPYNNLCLHIPRGGHSTYRALSTSMGETFTRLELCWPADFDLPTSRIRKNKLLLGQATKTLSAPTAKNEPKQQGSLNLD